MTAFVQEIDLDTFAARRQDGAYVIDVREPDEYVGGHVPGALLMPLGTLAGRASALPADRPIFVVCASGNRSKRAAAALGQAGLEAISVSGGTSAWITSGRPVVTGSAAA